MKRTEFIALFLIVFATTVWAQADENWRPLIADPNDTETVVVRVQDEAEVKERPQNQQPAYAELPVIDPDLLATAKSSGDESIRVIIYLNYMPHALLKDGVRDAHAVEMAVLKAQIDTITRRYADVRVTSATTDAENYSSMYDILPEDRAAIAALNEQHEALSLVMQRELKQALQAEIEPYQEPVVAALLALGAQVEFTTLSGNAIIALVPAEALPDVAEIPRIARIAADEIIHSNLDFADDATLVTSTKPGGGMWNNGLTGGIYDPAILDSGTDRTHPFMENQTYRTNHWSWYLVAGAADPNYDSNEGTHFEDDLQGHGSHVAGIVGSLGSTIYPNHRGMSYGVEKFVTLKAAFRNTATGGASMYTSDRMNLTDRALFRTAELYPTFGTNDFADDVDGFNLSYGGATTSDDTDSSRYIDSVIADTLADTPWTVSAGNSGPSNTNFNSPAISYNAITVAAADDLDTTSRSDDVLASYSSRGPTANGRKKPDLAAPGSDIKSANQNWESQQDWIEKDGTSMAAPMVLGVAMDLMDAGVWKELSIKALLINTAQKNEAGYNFESDSDGWDPGMGWGYMNAWAAYFHRADVKETTLTASGQPGDYRLYKGLMRDEGAGGEGRDRATMAWRRHATYSPNTFPATYYNLSDLDLVLYNEGTGSFIDTDSTIGDNVHQVRVASGTGATPVVIKPYSWSSAFPHGGSTETFALSTEEGFVEVSLPLRADVQPTGSWPTTVSAGATALYNVYLNNNGEVALHNVNFTLRTLPAGWALVGGLNSQTVGSAASGGGSSPVATWSLQAPAVPGVYQIWFDVSQSSYGESWGGEGWYLGVTVIAFDPHIFSDGFESGTTSAW